MSAKAGRCWKSRRCETGRILRARRHPRADRTRCRRRGGADPGSGVLRQYRRRPSGAASRGRRRQYQTRAILEDLTESESLLQTALNAGHLGALELHLPAFELEASDTCKTFYGRKASDSFTYQDLVDAIHPDDRIPRQEALDRSIKTGKDYSFEYRNIWPDGSVHWVDVRARAVRRPDGSIKSLVGVSTDITARKTSEIERENLLSQLAAERTALAELTATLEQRVEERTAELMKEVAAREKAQEQLRQAQKMETIGQLTGGVAHDFNNLLMAVMGNLDLLRKRVPNDPRLHRLIDGALQGAERGASLTQRLLAFARQQDLKAVPVDLGALVQGMIDLLERSLGPRIALRLEIPEHLPAARVDANQLELAILNLAINSRDAMPDGGSIDIRIAEYRPVGDSPLASGRYLQLSVIDTGKGMAPDILKKAIEPFFSSKPLGKGTGLGLSMVHGFAVQLGGALQLSSTVGKGTTATLILPVATAAPEAESPAHVPAKVNRSAVILFVDDDTPICRKARSSICRGWRSPTIRTSCAIGSISCWGEVRDHTKIGFVMRGLDPRIHHLRKILFKKTWMAGSSPAMTF